MLDIEKISLSKKANNGYKFIRKKSCNNFIQSVPMDKEKAGLSFGVSFLKSRYSSKSAATYCCITLI